MSAYRDPNEPEAEVLLSIRAGEAGLWRSLGLARFKQDLRVERIGSGHRVRIVGTNVDVRGPFELRGASRILDPRGHYFMRLEIRGSDGALSIGMTTMLTEPPNPARHGWFDGAELPNLDTGNWLVRTQKDLWALRDALRAIPSP